MAFEYKVPGVDIEKIVKSFADELYRNAQLQQRRQQFLDIQFDREFRLYSGKLRDQDLADFTEKFDVYRSAGVNLQRANRGKGGNLTLAGVTKEAAKRNMLDAQTKSAELGGYFKDLNAMRSQAKFLVERDQLDSVMIDAHTLTNEAFRTKYGKQISDWPKVEDFVWKPEKYDDTKNQTNIKKTLFFKPSTNMNVYEPKEANGQRKMMDIPFEINGVQKTFKVPVLTVAANPNASDVLDRVQRTTYDSNVKNFYDWNKDRLIEDSKDVSNLSAQQQSQKILKFAATLFNQDIDKLSPEEIYAASFINPDRPSSFDIPDMKFLNQQMKMEMQELNKLKAKKAIQKLNQDLSNYASKWSVKLGQGYVNLFEGLGRIGATASNEWMDVFEPLFKDVNLPIDKDTRILMYNRAIKDKLDRLYGYEIKENEEPKQYIPVPQPWFVAPRSDWPVQIKTNTRFPSLLPRAKGN